MHPSGGPGRSRVAAEQADQDVVTVLPVDGVGIVQALVDGAFGLNDEVVDIVVVGAEDQIVAIGARQEGGGRRRGGERSGESEDGRGRPECDPLLISETHDSLSFRVPAA